MSSLTSPNERICVDASLILRRLLPYEQDPPVLALFDDWLQRGAQLVGPPLLFIEVTSTLRFRVYQKKITEVIGDTLFDMFKQTDIQRIDFPDLHVEAWELAKQYGRSRAYDMLYLALAKREQIEFWTSDERLANALGGKEPLVHFLPISPPTP